MKMKKLTLLLIVAVCNFQNLSAQKFTNISINNLDSNNEYPNLGVAFFDDDFIIYTSQIEDRYIPKTRKFRKNKGRGENELVEQNLDFYFATLDGSGTIINSQKLGGDINSKYDDKGLCFSKSRDKVFFSRADIVKDSKNKHFEIFMADVVSPGSWSESKKLPFNDDYSSYYPALSEDGNTLYFASNKSGSYDIYKVAILNNWEFGKPEKLSSNINTDSDETSPFILNNILFFSSKKKGGLGGFDIYSINLKDKNAIALAVPSPINSNGDDFAFVVKEDSGQGYFSSNRAGGKGQEDLYLFNGYEIPEVKIEQEEVLVENKDETNKNIKLVTTETLVKNEGAFDFQRRDSYDKKTETKEVEVVEKTKKLSKSSYTNSLNIKKDNQYNECQMKFDKLNDIYFDYSEDYIRADAATTLNQVIQVLRLCPNVKLLAASHTDSRASGQYNLKLSQQRTNSVVHYLIKNGGFSADRIIGIGYGEERLVNRCSDGVECSEREHQLNRRTHFEIYNY